MKRVLIILLALLLASFSVSAIDAGATVGNGLLEVCEPADIVLVIDTSGSMITNEASPGVTRLDAAKASAKMFLDKLDTDDFSGLVSFATTSPIPGNTNVPLTSDTNAVKTEIDNLIGGVDDDQWTCIACGIDAAQAEIAANGRVGVNHVIILLSDGKATMTKIPDVPVTTQAQLDALTVAATQEARDSADAAKAAGSLMFTIGIGDFDPVLMPYMASFPNEPWFSSGTEDDLDDIYNAIADQICTPLCGDGNQDPGEQCDDGNNVDGDGCSAVCTTEQNDIPEFTTIGAALFLAGAGLYMYKKRRN